MSRLQHATLFFAAVSHSLALSVRPQELKSNDSASPQLLLASSSSRLKSAALGAELVHEPIEDFPREPPVKLKAPGKSHKGATLGDAPVTNATLGLRVHRLITISGRDLSLSAPDGTVMYSTQGEFFTMHAHTHFFEGDGGKEVAMTTKTWWSLHKEYEIHSYSPICPEQQAESERGIGGKKLFRFARLTEYLFKIREHWVLERYGCDGSLTALWDIQARWLFNVIHQYDIHEGGMYGPIVGSIDQAYFFQLTPYYNAFISKNEDQDLFAVATTLVDMAHLHKKSGGGGGSGHGGGGGGGGAGR